MAQAGAATLPKHHAATKSEKLVVGAASLGTVFEWYDFYLYGTLSVFFATMFFPEGNETAAFLSSLAIFGAGFGVRPFGALVFGRLGDLVGRKYTFLVTMILMGLSTALVGAMPTYAQIGVWAPVLLVVLRLLQGLALGGEYGGAATYVAEHAPNNKRGLYTSWIQTTATMGFFLSLIVIGGTRLMMDADSFKEWGWRLPFLVSVLLLAVSVWIRFKLEESPVYKQMKDEGKTSKNPLAESFGNWRNLKYVLLALFAATAGQGVVWYTGQFYAQFFMEKSLQVDWQTSYVLMAVALAIGTPLFVFFGWLSDKVGRKPILMAGFALAALTYFPLFNMMTSFANPALATAAREAPVTVAGSRCDFKVFATKQASACDKARDLLARSGVTYSNAPALASAEDVATITIGATTVNVAAATWKADQKAVKDGLQAEGWPLKADPARMNKPGMLLVLVILMVYVTMVYGPIAAFLVELFPTRIRYTSMSLPYHIGNGWFGGFLPFISMAMVAQSGHMYQGLWYPVVIAAMSLIVGLLLLKETRNANIDA